MRTPKSKQKFSFFESFSHHEQEEEKRACDIEGCEAHGEYRAPKSVNELNDYYHFCLDHVREYNSQWNYFKDFTDHDMESYLKNSFIWDMPTWKSGINPFMEDRLRDRIFDQFMHDEKVKFKFDSFSQKQEQTKKENFDAKSDTPEIDALDILGITPPTDLGEIKKQYKVLVKKYHPDINKGVIDAEEKVKKINAAYTVLKTAYTKYERIKD